MIFLHVDVDNLWIYEKEFGVKILKDPEFIYTHSLPILLKLLKKSNSKATFMIIGQDLLLPKCRKFCKKAVSEGHEIANHSWSHPVLFGKMSFKEKQAQIVKAHEIIAKVCKVEPIGFRGPGYYQDPEIVSILQKLNYKYDSSVLPGFSELLMKLYAYIRGGENRHKTFGRMNYLISSRNPYALRSPHNKKGLLELPISTLPVLRLPIHTTFAYFFGKRYRNLIIKYFNTKPKHALYLFHAIDFVNLETPDKNHPVIPLRIKFEKRISFLEETLNTLVLANGGPLKTSRETINSIKLRL
mgnify:CR=1 FL=1